MGRGIQVLRSTSIRNANSTSAADEFPKLGSRQNLGYRITTNSEVTSIQRVSFTGDIAGDVKVIKNFAPGMHLSLVKVH
jgi:hypothetical protein